MVRSQWFGAVVVGLVCTGLLWSQSPASPPAAPNLRVGTTITVNETGKMPEQCQIQASWTEPNGAQVLQVRSVSSGEIITVVAQAAPGVFRVYRWGQSRTPPAGVPTPPAPAAAAAAPSSPAIAKQLAAAPAPAPAATPLQQPAVVTARASAPIAPPSIAEQAGGMPQPATAPPAAQPQQTAPVAFPPRKAAPATAATTVPARPTTAAPAPPAPVAAQMPQPVSAASRIPSGIVPANCASMSAGKVVPALATGGKGPIQQVSAPLPVLPQPRDSFSPATPAINPAPNSPTMALPAINTRTAQPTPAQLTGNGAPAATAGPVYSAVSAPAAGPVSSAASAPTGTVPCAGCASPEGCSPDACGSACAGCTPSCSKPSLWSRLCGKSCSCPAAQPSCCPAPCPACPSSKPSLWSRMCGKSSTCTTCPADPCPVGTPTPAPAPAVPAVVAPPPQLSCCSEGAQPGCCHSTSTPCPSGKPSLWSRMCGKSSTCTTCPTDPCPVAPAPAPVPCTPAPAAPVMAAPPPQQACCSPVPQPSACPAPSAACCGADKPSVWSHLSGKSSTCAPCPAEPCPVATAPAPVASTLSPAASTVAAPAQPSCCSESAHSGCCDMSRERAVCASTSSCCSESDHSGCCPAPCAATCPSCGKPSLWSRVCGKSSCATCPADVGSVCASTPAAPTVAAPAQPSCCSAGIQPSCCLSACAVCSSCGKPSLWSRICGKSSCCDGGKSGCCDACPPEPCPGCTAPTTSVPAPSAPALTTPTPAPAPAAPEVAPHMPPVSNVPTSAPQLSDYRRSWGNAEQLSTPSSVQTTTSAKPNDRQAPSPSPMPAMNPAAPVINPDWQHSPKNPESTAQPADRLSPVAPAAASPGETSPMTSAAPAFPTAQPKRPLFSRLREQRRPGPQTVFPMEQMSASMPMPAGAATPPSSAEAGAGVPTASTPPEPAAPVEMMPAGVEVNAGRRPLFSRPLFRGQQQVVEAPQTMPVWTTQPAGTMTASSQPGAEGSPILHTVDGQGMMPPTTMAAPEKRGLLSLLQGRRQPAAATLPSEQMPAPSEAPRVADSRLGPQGMRPQGAAALRPIEVDANEPNAFSPEKPKEEKKQGEEVRPANAFPVPFEGLAQRPSVSLPPMRMPQAPMQVPQAPFTSSQPAPQMRMAADAGFPSGMANAFTPAWTGRPLPADLDNRPMPANAFGSGENMNTSPQLPQAAQMAAANAFPGGNGGMRTTSGQSMPGYLPPPDGARPWAPAGAIVPSIDRTAYNAAMPHMSLPPSPSLPAQALSTPQMLIMLRESLYPSQREWAAEQLSHLNWHTEQVVVAQLVQGAREDPAPAVRAACVHALGAMKVNTLPVVQTVQALQKDRDLRVRQEAAETLITIGASAPASAGRDDKVQRVGGSLPAE